MPDRSGGVLSMWRRGRSTSTAEGCDPSVFRRTDRGASPRSRRGTPGTRTGVGRKRAPVQAPVVSVETAAIVEAASEWEALELPPEPVEVVATEAVEKIDSAPFITELEGAPDQAGAPPASPMAPEPLIRRLSRCSKLHWK